MELKFRHFQILGIVLFLNITFTELMKSIKNCPKKIRDFYRIVSSFRGCTPVEVHVSTMWKWPVISLFFSSEESGPKLHCGNVVHYCCTCRLYMLTNITCCRCLRQLTWWSGRLILHFTALPVELWTLQIISASVSATWRQHCLWSVLYVICVHEGHLRVVPQ